MAKSCNFHTLSSRTPGSRQASPAEEHLPRLHGLEQSINVNVSGFSQPMMQHMMNNQHEQQQQMGSSFHQHQHQQQQHHQHPMGHHVLNGGMPVQVASSSLYSQFIMIHLIKKVYLFIILIYPHLRLPLQQNPMVNQGQNHIDSPANMLQQQASYEVSAYYYYSNNPYQLKRNERNDFNKSSEG